jgi:hypothetical protein
MFAKNKLNRLIALFLLVTATTVPRVATAAAVTLSEARGSVVVDSAMRFVELAEGTSLTDALGNPGALDWKNSLQPTLNLGFSKRPHLFAFDLSCNGNCRKEKRPLVEVAYPYFDQLALAFRNGSGKIVIQENNSSRGFFERIIPYHNHLFRAPELANGETRTLYLFVKSFAPLRMRTVVWTPAHFETNRRHESVAHGAFFGAIIAIFLYNLFLAAGLRERSYWPYLAFTLFSSLLIAAFEGYDFQFLWPGVPWLHGRAANLLACITAINLVWFSSIYLNVARHLPRARMFAMPIIGASIAAHAANLAPMSQTATLAANLVIVLGATFALSLGLLLFRRERAAPYFVAAFAVSLVGVGIWVLQNISLIPSNSFTVYSPIIATLIQQLLLSFGLADRINTIKLAKEDAEREALFARYKAEEERFRGEIAVGEARLQELGHVAIKLGDRMNNPLAKMTLLLEELAEANADSCTERELMILKLQDCVNAIAEELRDLNRFREFAPPDAVITEIGNRIS